MLSKKYLDENNLKKIQKKFTKAKPYCFVNINNFFNEKFLQNLSKEVLKEKYYLEENDLYKFYRTFDLSNSKNKKIIDFKNYLLTEDFREVIFKMTNIKVQKDTLDLHSLKLTKTNYLLCHDDDIQKRKLAFIIYLNDMESKDGGEFEVIETQNKTPKKIVKKILPKFNSFNIFRVEKDKSFHSISEVLTNKKRLSISGWFY